MSRCSYFHFVSCRRAGAEWQLKPRLLEELLPLWVGRTVSLISEHQTLSHAATLPQWRCGLWVIQNKKCSFQLTEKICTTVMLTFFYWHKIYYVYGWRDILLLSLVGCGKTTGVDVLGVDSEPWVFKGGVSGEVQVAFLLSVTLSFLLCQKNTSLTFVFVNVLHRCFSQ